jgi:SAM-dependent methyltransferase
VVGPDELRRRVLAAGDTPERRVIYAAWFAPGAPRKLRSAARRVPLERARVLDVGCGHGACLAHFGPGSLGLDRDPARVAFARSLGLSAQIRDVERPGWSRDLKGFELAWISDLLAHLREPLPFLRELAGALAPGGRIVASEWVWPEGRLARRLVLLVPGARRAWEEPQHVNRFSPRQVSELLAAAGFAPEACYVHTFASRAVGRALEPVWPPRTWIARRA